MNTGLLLGENELKKQKHENTKALCVASICLGGQYFF